MNQNYAGTHTEPTVSSRPPFNTITLVLLAKKDLDKQTAHFPEFVSKRLYPCQCHCPNPSDQWTIYNKIIKGLELTSREGYSLTGHIDEEWHTDTCAPGYIFIETSLSKAQETYDMSGGPSILWQFGNIYLVGKPDAYED